MPATTRTRTSHDAAYKRGFRAGKHAQITATKVKWNRLHAQIAVLNAENKRLEAEVEALAPPD